MRWAIFYRRRSQLVTIMSCVVMMGLQLSNVKSIAIHQHTPELAEALANTDLAIGTTQKSDVYFQARETVNPYYLACADISQKVMDEQFVKSGNGHKRQRCRGERTCTRTLPCSPAHLISLFPSPYLLECDFSGMTILVWLALPFLPLVFPLPLRGWITP